MTLPFPIQFASNGPQWAQGFDAWYDYTKPQGSQLLAFPPATDTHSATVYAQSSSGVWQAIPANVPSRTDLGLQTVPTRTEILTRSVFEGTPGATNRPTGWATTGANTSALTLLSSENVAGFSTLVMQIRRVGGGLEGIQQNIATTAVQHEISVFIRRPAGVTGSDAFFFENTNIYLIASAATINAQPSNVWVRYGITPTLTGSPTLLSFASGNGGAGTGFDLAMPSVKIGAFVTPPIPTPGTAATVNGNQQVVDLTGRLSAGVGIIMQFNAYDVTAAFKIPFMFSDGSSANSFVSYMNNGGGQNITQVTTSGINQGNVVIPGAPAVGVQTWVAVAGPNYHRSQKIGQSAGTTDTTVTWPTMTRLAIGGTGYNAVDNMYQNAMRMALRFGAANDAMFNDLMAKATILNAVS
jgi:hypothetical protein